MDYDEVTTGQALRALTASAELAGGVVRGTVGSLPVRWLLAAARDMVRFGDQLVIAWDATTGTLLLIGLDQALYSFATVDPFTVPPPQRDTTPGRPGLRLVPDPS